MINIRIFLFVFIGIVVFVYGGDEEYTEELKQFRLYTKSSDDIPQNDEDNIHAVIDKKHRRLGLLSHVEAKPPKAKFEGFGMQYMDAYFGNPAQLLTLAVTTSIPYTAFACEDCTENGCLRGDDKYNSSKSENFEKLGEDQCPEDTKWVIANNLNHCEYSWTNENDLSSFHGYVASDDTYIGGANVEGPLVGTTVAKDHGFPSRFICQRQTKGFFRDNKLMDGIISFADAETSFINQLAGENGPLKNPRFSLCFNPAKLSLSTNTGGAFTDNTDPNHSETSTATSDSNQGTGMVTLGGFDTRTIMSKIVYVKNIPTSTSSYGSVIKRMYLREGGGSSIHTGDGPDPILHSINVPHGQTGSASFDSYHPYITFVEAMRAPFLTAWADATGEKFEYGKQSLTDEQVLQLPTLVLELQGDESNKDIENFIDIPALTANGNVLVACPPESYMEKNPLGGEWRARLQFADNIESSMLGASFFRGHNCYFKNDAKLIGIAEVHNCDPADFVPQELQYQDAPDYGTVVGGGDFQGAGLEQYNTDTDYDINSSSGSTLDTVVIVPDNSQSDYQPYGGTRITGPAAGATDVADDDLFEAPPEANDEYTQTMMAEHYSTYVGGSCTSATCRCFLAVGYVLVGTSLAMAYRLSRPKDREMQYDPAKVREANNRIGSNPMAYRGSWNDNASFV